ncbi:hypothetical protein [Nostoc sp. 'Peltigera membranacea cyanobiont' 213]|uniref:hypothetical protein n=1 Tax=Nostoc sp. 'Peltigera membranacea cyanobiont' 213 TaxID=2014530 RepID=UPI001CB8EEB4|nr:hypothetical protein [Nostoc sp. 'Peltigera membranacea cyanobiont' 213]
MTMNLLSNADKFFQIITYLGIFALSACAPASSQGQVLTPKEGNFSILMPGSVVEEVNTPLKGITTRTWTAIKGESAYTVAQSTFAKKIAPEKIPKILQALSESANESNFVNGKKISETSVMKNGYKCLDFTLTGVPSPSLQAESKKNSININSKLMYQRSLLCIKDSQAVEALALLPSSEELKSKGASFIQSLNLK